LIDFSSLFPHIWVARCRPRDEPTSTIRNSLSDPWFHHVEFLGKRNHFSASISTAASNSSASMDGSGLPRSNAHSFRAFFGRNAHCHPPPLSDSNTVRAISGTRGRAPRLGKRKRFAFEAHPFSRCPYFSPILNAAVISIL